MKGLKKLAIASAVLAVSTGAFAMEALQDDDMSATTGQAGLTITTSGTNISTQAIRYYDKDGIGVSTGTDTTTFVGANGGLTAFLSGAAYNETAGTFTGKDPNTIIKNFTTDNGGAGGSINISGFSVSLGQSVTTLDVASTGTGATATSALLIGLSANTLNTGLIISFDNGTELSGSGLPGTSAPANASVNNIGGIAITGLTIPKTVIAITAGATDLGTTSGLTISPLLNFNLGLTLSYYDTTKQTYNAGTGAFTASAGANDGLISLPIAVYGALAGAVEIAAGSSAVASATNAGYAGSTTDGLRIYSGGLGAIAVDIGNEGGNPALAPNTGIQLAGSDAGSVAILGLKVAASTIAIYGH